MYVFFDKLTYVYICLTFTYVTLRFRELLNCEFVVDVPFVSLFKRTLSLNCNKENEGFKCKKWGEGDKLKPTIKNYKFQLIEEMKRCIQRDQ